MPAASVAWTLVWWAYATAVGHHRDLTWWAADAADPYVGRQTDDGFYGYSPAFLQLLTPLRALPWEAAVWAWAVIMLAALAYCAGRWTPLVIIAPPVLGELVIGNIHLLYAAAIVVGFRWPAAWALMLLTKVTPGIGLLWFAVRREWRHLAVALGATLIVALASIALAPGLWLEWVAAMAASAQVAPLPVQPNALFPVPLVVRLPVAAALLVWGARRDSRWVVPVAVTMALPVVWTAGLATLVAVVALSRRPAWPLSLGRSRASFPRTASARQSGG